MSCQPGDMIAGKYRLLESVGGGAMGEVFRAEHILMHKTVAIKILHHHISGNTEIIERFKREAQASAAINHANICNVLDFDHTEEGDFYLVMEYLKGTTLQKRLLSRGFLSPQEAVFIMLQLLSVLQRAHDNGIVHRDVKPENIALIIRDDTDNFVKLLDFGIAHREEISSIPHNGTGATLTQAGLIYGTPTYIAPEQANGDTIDHRVDLYACGIILFEMLTGTLPFKSESIINVLHQQIFNPPPHLDVGSIECGEGFDDIIQKLLSKDPNDRFQSAREVSAALQELPLSKIEIAPQSPIFGSDPGPGQSINGQIPTIYNKSVGLHYGRRILVAIALTMLSLVAFLVVLVVLESDEKDILNEIPIDTSDPDMQSLQEVSDVQPFMYDGEFLLSNDTTLRKDMNLLKAYEACFQKDYQSCYDNIRVVHGRYKNHPNYLLFLIQTSRTLSRRRSGAEYKALMDEIVSDYIELSSFVPDAIKNSVILEAVTYIFTDSKKWDAGETIEKISQKPSEALAKSIAQSIILLPYDQNEKRKNNMFLAYDALPHNGIPDWQSKALEAWKLKKDQCRERDVILREALRSDAPKKDLYDGLLKPLYDHLAKGKDNLYCKSGLISRDCNYCMKAWIEAGYGEWSELDAEGRLDEATLSFLEPAPASESDSVSEPEPDKNVPSTPGKSKSPNKSDKKPQQQPKKKSGSKSKGKKKGLLEEFSDLFR